jgi:hypothetical protein
LWQGISGPASFGSGGLTLASGATGADVGIDGALAELQTPDDYVSGSALSDTLTFDNTTISGLGLTPGTYTYTWGGGPDADSYTVDIEASASTVPEPGSLALFGSALALLAVRRRGRTRYTNMSCQYARKYVGICRLHHQISGRKPDGRTAMDNSFATPAEEP